MADEEGGGAEADEPRPSAAAAEGTEDAGEAPAEDTATGAGETPAEDAGEVTTAEAVEAGEEGAAGEEAAGEEAAEEIAEEIAEAAGEAADDEEGEEEDEEGKPVEKKVSAAPATEEDAEADGRLDFLFNYASKAVKVKWDKWLKLLSNEDNMKIFLKFFDDPKEKLLILLSGGGGTVSPTLDFPPTPKKKFIYFMRKLPEVITDKNIRTVTQFGELSCAPISELAVWVDEVCVPVLSSHFNHQGWPTVVAEDVVNHVHKLNNTVFELKGKVQGQILLPMPLGIERVYEAEHDIAESDGEIVDLYLKSAIEGTVIKWAKQINLILVQDSTFAFREGRNPIPDVEIKFWQVRVKNLECIYDQLRDPRVQKMASILELTESAYYSCFKSIFRNVIAALVEARDINLYLKPLAKQLDKLASQDFADLVPYFHPLMQNLCLLWGYSRYYCSTSKLVVMIKQICNYLIEEASKYLDPGAMFQGEPRESIALLEKALTVFDAFRQLFDVYGKDIEQYFPEGVEPIPWNFHTEIVFDREIAFVERLQLVLNLFQNCQEYLKLEKVEIGGLHGQIISDRIQVVYRDFLECYGVFLNILYDPLIPEDDSFIVDYETFMERVEEFDRKLAALFHDAWNDCHNLDHILKLINNGGTLLDREIIKKELAPCYKTIVKMLDKDATMVKEIFEAQTRFYILNKYMLVDTHWPPVAGALMWLEKLEKRLSMPVEQFELLEHPIVESRSAVHVLDKCSEMFEIITTLKQRLFTNWARTVPRICVNNLTKTLLLINDYDYPPQLQLNFDDQLRAILREMKYMKLLHMTDLPKAGEALHIRDDELTQWVHHLNRIVECYNQVRKDCQEVEFNLVVEEVEHIDELIGVMQEKVNWLSKDGFEYISEIHELMKDLHLRLLRAQNNILEIVALLAAVAAQPLFERKDRKPENVIYLEDREERVKKRYAEITRAASRIHSIVKTNYCLLLNLPFDEPEEQEEKSKKRSQKGIDDLPGASLLDFVEDAPVGEQDEEEKPRVRELSLLKVVEKEEEEEELGEAETEEAKDEFIESLVAEEEAIAETVARQSRMSRMSHISSVGSAVSTEDQIIEDPSSVNVFRKTKQGKSILGLMGLQPDEEDLVEILTTEFEYILLRRPSEEVRIYERKVDHMERWRDYEYYIDEIVYQGLLAAVGCSIHYFMTEMDDTGDVQPFFEVALVLQEPQIAFVPSMDAEDPNGFLAFVKSLIDDIYGMSNLVPRVFGCIPMPDPVTLEMVENRQLLEYVVAVTETIAEYLSLGKNVSKAIIAGVLTAPAEELQIGVIQSILVGIGTVLISEKGDENMQFVAGAVQSAILAAVKKGGPEVKLPSVVDAVASAVAICIVRGHDYENVAKIAVERAIDGAISTAKDEEGELRNVALTAVAAAVAAGVAKGGKEVLFDVVTGAVEAGVNSTMVYAQRRLEAKEWMPDIAVAALTGVALEGVTKAVEVMIPVAIDSIVKALGETDEYKSVVRKSVNDALKGAKKTKSKKRKKTGEGDIVPKSYLESGEEEEEDNYEKKWEDIERAAAEEAKRIELVHEMKEEPQGLIDAMEIAVPASMRAAETATKLEDAVRQDRGEAIKEMLIHSMGLSLRTTIEGRGKSVANMNNIKAVLEELIARPPKERENVMKELLTILATDAAEGDEGEEERQPNYEEEGEEEEEDQPEGQQPTYREDLNEHVELGEMETEILCRVRLAMAEAQKYAQKFEKFSYLWLDDRETLLQQFLTYGRTFSSEFDDGTVPADAKPAAPTLKQFKEQIDSYGALYNDIDTLETQKVLSKWFKVDVRPFKQALLNTVCKWSDLYKQYLVDNVNNKLSELEAFSKLADEILAKEVEEGDYETLVAVINILNEIRDRSPEYDVMFDPIKDTMDMLREYDVQFPDEIFMKLQELPEKWKNTKKTAATVKQAIQPLIEAEMTIIKKKIMFSSMKQLQYLNMFHRSPVFQVYCEDPYAIIDQTKEVLLALESETEEIRKQGILFEVSVPDFKVLKVIDKDLKSLKVLWDYFFIVKSSIDSWKQTLWKNVDCDSLEMKCKTFLKELKALDKDLREWEIYKSADASVNGIIASVKALADLQNPCIKDRHWAQLMSEIEKKFVMSDKAILADLLKLELQKHEEEAQTMVDLAVKETAMEKILKELEQMWSKTNLDFAEHERTGLTVLVANEETIQILEENQVQLQNLSGAKFGAHFLAEIEKWQRYLSTADQVLQTWFEVQRSWENLESIFMASEDIRNQLPEDSRRFDATNEDFRTVLKTMVDIKNVVQATNQPGLYEELERIQQELAKCEKALSEYLETKRLAYPRFYFISQLDLLDILSNGDKPVLVAKHLSKLYDSMAKLQFGNNPYIATAVWAKDGEILKFSKNNDCSGKVEVWLNRLTDTMRYTVREYLEECVGTYEEHPRESWIFMYCAQPALVGSQIWWTTEVNIAMARLEEGYENALKEYNKKQITQLNTLIAILCGDLTAENRQKIMTICTIDVHARDVVAKLIALKVENGQAFQWLAQLRHRWDDSKADCFCNICDAEFRYAHEYLGCTPRLVITPLTDRCYITLTQSLHLILGGAPAGPAGTGKTETTKDLGRAMGVMVYVFNCSEQMDYKSCGNIYKGLSQTGAWGCFDEFNRISVEVLSVVAVQVKSVLDAIKAKKTIFLFAGQSIRLIPTVGMFITMNPGYAGRTELPENLKALFRPCAMVVPDFGLICEIMLVAEGFQNAKQLALKFITLYTLCRELLSKQDHYDWGLRAIKSVLVVAGALKRADRERPEDQVLMRALRDFNTPKIVTEDIPIFLGLIGDLFPALDVPRKRDLEFEALVKKSTLDQKLQPEDSFILKVVQLEELLAVRHSVFIIGAAGSGKSRIWQTLHKTYYNQGRKPMYNDLNPKAVTNNELFGIINPTTREWKDGLISVILRDQANLGGDNPKWILLDGDIDPMWIESLNTVMDDNKVLTLASNERIALSAVMRLLFEIAHLRAATPATVSRAGILYVSYTDVGWNPFVNSWIDKRTRSNEKNILLMLIDKYVPYTLDVLNVKFKKITPIVDIAHVQMLCYLLECLLIPANVPTECPKEWYEIYFCFAAVWAFGSATFADQTVDYRYEFSKWWTNEFKSVRFPLENTVFDYFIDPETKRFIPWTKRLMDFELDYGVPLQESLVDIAETSRMRYFMDILIEKQLPVMLVGPTGSGKSVIIKQKLGTLPDSYDVTNVPFNFYTTSEMLQAILEKPLEKKAGRNYGPKGNKTMVYFVDDMNMPEVDTYGTVQPHTLIRQYLDYHHWYDRIKLSIKDIHKIQFLACMNPTAGSFTINPRLQRHFATFSLSYPKDDSLVRIYNNILEQHLGNPIHKFPISVSRLNIPIVKASMEFHKKMQAAFLPTAIKFHYLFTLRDLSNVFQGMLFSTHDCLRNEGDLLRLWVHETCRVYLDKMVEDEDVKLLIRMLREVAKKGFESIKEDEVFKEPLIFAHFAEGIGDSKYLAIKEWPDLYRLLDEALSQYNDLVSAMNLVLFEDASLNVCRINRILESPRGNALLVGVGGSGKQSLSRLAAFIAQLGVVQIQLSGTYGVNDLRDDLAVVYQKVGLRNMNTMFLMTDAQVAEERFLVLINDLLASGTIPGLFDDDTVDEIINTMRSEARGSGLVDTPENIWGFFIDKVRLGLKVVLCFSPVGSTLRVRARRFPAIINCSSINWFHEWPQSALESVSARFLEEIDVLPDAMKKSVSLFMAFVHTSVNSISAIYLAQERRYNYTTPKTFLELISLYTKLLSEKTTYLSDHIFRLDSGLKKLASTEKQVDGLKVILATQEVEVNEKNKAADELIKIVGAETDKVSEEKAIAAEEEAKVRVIEEDVSVKQRICEIDLLKAEPALLAAQEALNTLNKNNLTELKSFGAPPEIVVTVAGAVLTLFSTGSKPPKDRSWKACKVMMGKVDWFLDALINYDKENMNPDLVKAVKEIAKNPEFDAEKIRAKSIAAAGLCAWVVNILKFYDVFVFVKPKRDALAKANNDLQAARDKLSALNEKIHNLEEQLQILTTNFEAALAEKTRCQEIADKTAYTIDLANRLVLGLASEKIRWRETLVILRDSGVTLPGDVLVVSAFISYVGCFTRKYRHDLMIKHWLPFLTTMKVIKLTPDLDPLALLTDDAQIAEWNNEGLPNDKMSAENATILSNSQRWPLMIDPQLQGIKWIKKKYDASLVVLRLEDAYLSSLEQAISAGKIVLIENIGESVDPVLEPLLGRVFVQKGKAIKIGDKEITFNQNFRLILHTKLANPHYKPEMQAQTTLINFTVTIDGLEEQLLAEVVKAERPDLEETKTELTRSQNEFKITLKRLEDDLLHRLASAGDNILSDVTLVENLEKTKTTAAEIQIKVAEAKETSKKIDEAREEYRPAGARGSLLYFVLNELCKINLLYQFSLKAFTVVFSKALHDAEPAHKLEERVENLMDCITFSVFVYTSRGLFEKDKLIFLCQMTLQILLHAKEVDPAEVDFLLRFPQASGAESPVDFLTDSSWGAVMTLTQLPEFLNLDKDIEASSKRWKKFAESECPEREKFPGDWKSKSSLQRLCMMRILRPDRMTYAVKVFIEENIGKKYVESRTPPFTKSYKESSSTTPVFFILSPGVDPLKDVEKLGKKLGFTLDRRNLHNVSLGQGQEIVAEEAMLTASKKGHWVILQNVHLVARWLPALEKRMEKCAEIGTEKYRLFISAEADANPMTSVIPQGILESSIKITNEPPTGMLANLHMALDNFSQETLEMCSKEAEFKGILFALCYFHAAVAERRKFGAQGWNRVYPFNFGDLTISVNVLYNYLENNSKVPWEDLRYLFGEIMYGGHITDDWDRRLCRTYLEVYMKSELFEGDFFYAPGVPAPPNTDYTGYHRFIDMNLTSESPALYGLHPNAEIGVLTAIALNLFNTVFELQPKDTGAAGAAGVSREDTIKNTVEEIMDKLPDCFDIFDMMSKIEDFTPYTVVAVQECDRMNKVLSEMHRSLNEIVLQLKGELTMTEDMEILMDSLFMEKVPDSWSKRAYASTLPLGPWFSDFIARFQMLESWTGDFLLPPSVWLGGFFNPQSFLTAIMQSTARKNEWPLDRMCLHCDVTKKQKEDITEAPREGAHVHGLYMEGAQWDMKTGGIIDAKLKELFPVVPVIFIKAITQDKQDTRNVYECPVYKIRARGPTFVWTFNLRTKEDPKKWTLGGVAIILQI